MVALVVANSLNPDQDRQNVSPYFLSVLIWIQTVYTQSDSVPTLNQIVFLKEFFKKLILKRSQHTSKNSMKNYTACKEFNYHTFRRLNNKGAKQTVLNCMLIYAAHLSLAYNKKRLSHVISPYFCKKNFKD